MSERLPPRARALLDAARGADEPSADDRARIDAAMQRTLSAHGIPLLRESEPPPSAGADAGGDTLVGVKGALHVKLVGGVLAGALGAAGLLGALVGLPSEIRSPTSTSANERPPRVSPARTAGDDASAKARAQSMASDAAPLPARMQVPRTPAAPEAAEPVRPADQEVRAGEIHPPPATPRVEAPEGVGVRRAQPTRTEASVLAKGGGHAPAKKRGPRRRRLRAASRRPGSSAAESKGTHLRAEMELLAAARHALGEGDPQRALRRLQRHAQRFPNGALQQERTGLRVLALCRAGRVIEGRALRDRLLQKAPGALMAVRVQHACDAPAREEQP